MMKWGRLCWLAGGALAGTLGVRILRSKEMKKVYSHATAAVIREKNHIMKFVTDVREDCGAIYADAKEINEKYAAEEEQIIADRAAKHADEAAKAE